MLIATSLQHAFGLGASRTPVLRNVSLEIRAGELTLIAGPSGCGKSTLLAILCGLLEPNSGRVRVLGQDLGTLNAVERDRFRLSHMGFVFQNFSLFPGLTALEQVCMPLAYMGVGKPSAERRARDALGAVGLTEKVYVRPAALSGGEQQRVAIARAMAKNPRLLFADEPTSALDSENGRSVIELLRQIGHDRGALVVCVSHDPRLIARADRVLYMQDGVISDQDFGRDMKSASVTP